MSFPDSAGAPRPRVGPGVAVGVTEAMIHELVHRFYARVRADAVLGPIFDRVIGDHWDEHLAKLCDFWSSVVLMTGRYHGRPMAAHFRIDGLDATHFGRWLALFRLTASETCPPEAAALFVARAETIAESFQLGLAVNRGEPPPLSQRAAR